MANLMNQMRGILTGAEENKADPGGSRDQKIPIQKTQTLKAKKSAQNWFQRHFSSKESRDYDSREMEHGAAVAAAAFAINSQEVSEIPQKSPISKPRRVSKRFSGSFKFTDDKGKKVPISLVSDEKKPEKAITPAPSMKKSSTFLEHFKITDPDDKKRETPAPEKTPTFADDKNSMITKDDKKPETPAPGVPPPVQTPTRAGTRETKADAWERTELEKIKERHEKLKETIDSWESKKKMKARRQLDRQESELERTRLQTMEKFQNKMKYIDQIAQGARAQADERRRNQELKAKEKANVIRTGGKLPGTFSCF